jgi:hypothetical protein
MKKLGIPILGITLAATACGDATGPGSNGQPVVTLSFATRQPATASLARGLSLQATGALADTLTTGGDTLIITRARIVMREIELERVEATSCDTTIVDHDACEEFEIGPVLVDLPLNGQVEQEFSVAIAPGSYDEIEFEIHKVSNDDQEDADFRNANPDFAGISIRVDGTFNGTDFVFTSDLDVEQEFDLNPPLTVDSTAAGTNVTILVGLDGWFRSPAGAVLNPETGNKGEVNESLIKENIKQSIEAFEDEDEDGEDDDGDDRSS